MNKYFVYKITNVINGKIYIGITSQTIPIRFERHILTSKRPKSERDAIHNAIAKYGKNNFQIEEIDIVYGSKRDAEKVETQYILYYKSLTTQWGYNIVLEPGKLTKDMYKKRTQKKKSSFYYGVCAYKDKKNNTYYCCRIKGVTNKRFNTEIEAAEHYDMAVLYANMDRYLNFPDKREYYLSLDLEAIVARKRVKSSKYKGVSKFRNKWQSFFTPYYGTKINIGTFDTPEEAATSYDKVCFYIRNDKSQLNFPEQMIYSKIELKEYYDFVSQKNIKTHKVSKYRGVSIPTNSPDKFTATCYFQGKNFYAGIYSAEIMAAIAHDKKAIELGVDSKFYNFPNLDSKYITMTWDEFDSQFNIQKPLTKIGFFGVSQASKNTYFYKIQHNKQIYRMAGFYSAEEAALAHDRKYYELTGKTDKLNFPEKILSEYKHSNNKI